MASLALLASTAAPAWAAHQPSHHDWFGFYHVVVKGQPQPPDFPRGLDGTATFLVPPDGYVSLIANFTVGIPGQGLCYVSEPRFEGSYHLPSAEGGDDTHDASGAAVALDFSEPGQGPNGGYAINARQVDLFSSERRFYIGNDGDYPPQPPDGCGTLPAAITTTGKASFDFGSGVTVSAAPAGSPAPTRLCGQDYPVESECLPAQGITVTVQTGAGPVTGLGTASWDFGRTAPDSWDRTMSKAERQYHLAIGFGGQTKGFYLQMLNLACAASRSADASCDPMAKYYAEEDWTGTWIHDVFNGVLKQYGGDVDRARVQDLERRAGRWSSLLRSGCVGVQEYISLRCRLLKRKDLDTAFVGALHFAMLQREFDSATRRAISDALHSGADELTALRDAITEIRRQHEALFCLAVVPGFHVVGGRGAISEPAEQVAIRAVPYVAAKLRERAIRKVLIDKFGKRKADYLLQQIGAAPPTGCPE